MEAAAAVVFCSAGWVSSNYREEGTMNPEEKVLLTTAFEALGPERVTRGLKATGHRWNHCFLPIATNGAPDALAREMEQSRRKKHVVRALIGVPGRARNELDR